MFLYSPINEPLIPGPRGPSDPGSTTQPDVRPFFPSTPITVIPDQPGAPTSGTAPPNVPFGGTGGGTGGGTAPSRCTNFYKHLTVDQMVLLVADLVLADGGTGAGEGFVPVPAAGGDGIGPGGGVIGPGGQVIEAGNSGGLTSTDDIVLPGGAIPTPGGIPSSPPDGVPGTGSAIIPNDAARGAVCPTCYWSFR